MEEQEKLSSGRENSLKKSILRAWALVKYFMILLSMLYLNLSKTIYFLLLLCFEGVSFAAFGVHKNASSVC